MGEAIRSLLQSSSSHHRPRQLAAAIAMGVLCGLLPKLSFTFCLVASVCFLLPIHIPLAALVCVTCSLATTSLAPVAGRLGIWSLTNSVFSEFWLALDALPLVPWLGLHNSVVNGSLMIGLSLWLPVFYLSRPIGRWLAPGPPLSSANRADPDFAQELRPSVAEQEQQTPVWNEPSIEVELPVRRIEGDHAAAHLVVIGQVDQSHHENNICRDLETLLENCSPAQAEPMSVNQVVERASQIAHYVDQLLTTSESDAANVEPAQYRRVDSQRERSALTPLRTAASASTPNYLFDDAAEDRSTVRSVVDESLAESQVSASKGHSSGDSGTYRRHGQHSTAAVGSPQTHVLPVRQPVGNDRQQEALRYLLHHLKAFKDKV